MFTVIGAIIGLILAFGLGYTLHKKKMAKQEEERYQQYRRLYMNPLSKTSWQEIENFTKNLQLAFIHSKPFDANHYDLDHIMKTYPRDRIIRKLYEDMGFNQATKENHQMRSLGFKVQDTQNLFNFFNICELVLKDNTSIGFPINNHFVVVGKDKGAFFISMPYDIINPNPKFEKKDY